ncbi:PIN domain-like [Phytophthora cactorum]|nr:PIN domain-like [Phytophthora cactorum]
MFFKYNSALGPPYNVIVDTNFINFSIKNKLEVVSAMMDCLLAKLPSQSAQRQVATTPTAKSSILQTQAEQRSRLLDEYFESTKLLQVVQDFMTNLATTYKTQLRLPANPYPELLKTIRMHELRQAFVLESSKSRSTPLALTVLNGQTLTPLQFQVCSVDHEQFALPIWGMKSCLEQLTGTNLYSLLALVNSSFRGLVIYKEFTDDDCRATAYGALVGNCVLGARVQDLQPCFLELETHVFVSGVHLEKTMAVFARFLLKQLHEIANAASNFSSLRPEEAAEYRGCVACDGITITSSTSSEDVESAVWSIDRVKESRVTFINAVKTALVSNSLITLNRYDAVELFSFNGGYLCQTEQAVFFHFAMEEGSRPAKNVTADSRRSFLIGSRALATGVFFDPQGALEVAARFRTQAQVALEEERKKQSQNKKQAGTPISQSVVVVPGARPRSGFIGVLQNTVDELRRIGLSNEIFRQQLNSLVSCFVFNLGTTMAPPVSPATASMQLENSATLDEIDVLRALEMAVEERKYPSSIVSEAIFAQAVLNSCLDVALESAVMNTVAIHLPPNPFIDMSSNLQVFALRQLVQRYEEQKITPKNITKIAECGSRGVFSLEGINVCALNPKLLQLVGGDRVLQAQRGSWTTTSSTKAPTNHRRAPTPWKEFDQARLFFMEAVRLDLRRVTSSGLSIKGSNCWQLQARARMLDPHGQIVAELNLSRLADAALAGFIEEATRTQIVVQVVIQVAEEQTQRDISGLVIHKVTKAYAFHHHSTADHDVPDPSTHLTPLISFRVSEYGVFFSKENALLCFQFMQLDVCHGQGSGIPRDAWTPYASEAYNYDDSFLIYQLGVVQNIPGCGSPQQDCDNALTNRLTVQSDICQLYSVQTKLQQLTCMQSKSRKEDISSELPQATLFRIHLRLALQIIAQVEQVIVSLNHQLHFLPNISGPLATLQKCVTRWQAIQPPTEEQLEIQCKQQDKTPEILPTPREDPVIITSELVDSLRTTWILVLFFRFSYQRAFFANAGSK